jgi:Cu-Zn family superoxide dismutase
MQLIIVLVCLVAYCTALHGIAVLTPTKGNTAEGVVTFSPSSTAGLVTVSGTISGLKPNSAHGFHVHQYGDISGDDGLKTGGHFNPFSTSHGCPKVKNIHTGDFGNITADAHGSAKINFSTDQISLDFKDENCIFARGLIVHEKFDDCISQPVGNAGARIAQAVIGVAADPKKLHKLLMFSKLIKNSKY